MRPRAHDQADRDAGDSALSMRASGGTLSSENAWREATAALTRAITNIVICKGRP